MGNQDHLTAPVPPPHHVLDRFALSWYSGARQEDLSGCLCVTEQCWNLSTATGDREYLGHTAAQLKVSSSRSQKQILKTAPDGVEQGGLEVAADKGDRYSVQDTNACMYVHTHTHAHTNTHAYTPAHPCLHTCTPIYTHLHPHTHCTLIHTPATYTHLHTHIHTPAPPYIHTCTPIHTHLHAHTHTPTHTPAHPCVRTCAHTLCVEGQSWASGPCPLCDGREGRGRIHPQGSNCPVLSLKKSVGSLFCQTFFGTANSLIMTWRLSISDETWP